MPKSSRMKSVFLGVRTRMSLPRRDRPDFKQQCERDFARIQHPLWSVLSKLLGGDVPLREGFGRFGDSAALMPHRDVGERFESLLLDDDACEASEMAATRHTYPGHQEKTCLKSI